jgi:Zn-dependent protease with chaperone function
VALGTEGVGVEAGGPAPDVLPAPTGPGAEQAPPPVLVLPSVPLPPAPEAARRPRGATGASIAVLLLLLGAVLLAVGVLVALALLVYVRPRLYTVLLLLAYVVPLGRASLTFLNPPAGEVPGVRLDPGSEPALEAFVAELADEVGTRPPDEISLVVDVNAMVTEVGPLLGLLRGTRRMAIGVSLFDALDVSQMRAVLGHELGHFAGRHNRITVLANKVEMALACVIADVGPSSVVGALYRAYWHLHRRVGAAVSRRQERIADEVAVRLAGRQATADALNAIRVSGRIEGVLRDDCLRPLLRDVVLPWDVQYGFWRLASDPWTLRACAQPEPPDEPDPWATHPALEVRIQRVADLGEPPTVPPHDGRAARVLLRDANERTEKVRVAWAQQVVGDVQMKRLPWEEALTPVAAARAQDAAIEVDFVLRRMGMNIGLRGVYEAHTAQRDRELVSRLVASGWRTGATDEWRAVLRTILVVTAARDAVAVSGCSFDLSWSAPVGLVDLEGQELPLAGWVDQAMAGDWRPLVQGLRLDKAALPTADAVATRQAAQLRKVPVPPSPPFVRGTGRWRWQAKVPGRLLLRHADLFVGDDALGVGTLMVPYGSIEHVTVSMKRFGVGVRGRIVLAAGDGVELTVPFFSLTRPRTVQILQVGAFVWDLMVAHVAGRVGEEAMLQIAEGHDVTVGGLVLSRAGLATVGDPGDVAPWSAIGDARLRGRKVVVPRHGGPALRADPDAQDAILLDRLIPQARALLA